LSRARRVADRIREEISLASVLVDYGYEIYADDGGREQQFSCDLHGDGSDSKPSARLYPENNQFYCFACGRSRDAIALVREKEGASFWDAVKLLETRYNLAPLPWEDGDDSPKQQMSNALEQALNPSETPDQALTRLGRFLDNLCKDRALTAQRCAGFWEAHDRISLFVRDGGEPVKAIAMAHRVLEASKSALREE